MILAGDIGGTKTVLALFSAQGGFEQPIRQQRYPSDDFASLEDIVADFLSADAVPPRAACFGIAGPVIGRQCRTTNLPWTICADTLAERFGIARTALLNDVQATATAVPHLPPSMVHTLSTGHRDPTGAIGVVAPGTGLGEAFLIWTGDRYVPCACEGGHVSFAPVTLEQLELLQYLERRFGHVSCERVASGSGISNIYDHVVATGRFQEPEWLSEALAAAEDRTPIIVQAALERRAPICIAALDLFVHVLGGVAGNMALKVLATGGVYLAGGMPPRILNRLKQPDFLDAMRYKGRFRDWVARIPVHVVLDHEAPLHGAALNAFALAGETA